MNNLNSLFNVMGSIVTVAMISVVVGSPQTRGIINALGNAFSGALREAKR